MLENFINLFGTFEVQALIRIILAAILAGIIGYERQSWKKPAGLRTHILVCESAVIVMLCGLYIQEKVGGSDPSRIPAQLLSGMGFIGAGTILRDGFHVKGLTTAASLLAGLSTASCSIPDVTTRPQKLFPRRFLYSSCAAWAIPKSAALSASVAPDVKTTSLGREAPSSDATCLRASSIASKAALPGEWSEFAFMPRLRLAVPGRR